jgi:hypothetical protein
MSDIRAGTPGRGGWEQAQVVERWEISRGEAFHWGEHRVLRGQRCSRGGEILNTQFIQELQGEQTAGLVKAGGFLVDFSDYSRARCYFAGFAVQQLDDSH